MIKKIEMPDVRGVIIREPINIDEPIILDDHIPPPRPYTNDRRDLRVIPYPRPKADRRLNVTELQGCAGHCIIRLPYSNARL